MKSAVRIMLWGEEIGRLNWESRRSLGYFTFNADFISKGLDIAPLEMRSLAFDPVLPIMGDTEQKMYHRLPPFLADSLPDAWGNMLFDQWVSQQGLRLADITPLEELCFIGRRAMGALEFMPETEQPISPDPIDVRALDQLAQRIYKQREKLQLLPDEKITIQTLIQVGTSAGGMRPKAIIAMNKDGEIRSGQITGQEGFDYYILKFGNAKRQTAELELTYYQMAIAAGIEMSECRLWAVDGVNHFLTKRFDRVNGEKVHMQTLAAIDPEARSYDKLFWVGRKLRITETEIEELFRRMVFNILANNTDDHNKNFSFLMDKKGQWRISPAYDLTYIFDEGGFTPYRFHCLSIAGQTCDIKMADVVDFGRRNSIRNPEGVIRKIAKAVEQFPQLAAQNGVRVEWIDRVWATLQNNLHDWHLIAFENESPYRFEMTYKGNYHLFVRQEDGRERRYVIRPKMPEYDLIQQQGVATIPDSQIASWVENWRK